MGRANHSNIYINDKIYIFGGYNGLEYLNSIEMFDGISWNYVSFMNVARI